MGKEGADKFPEGPDEEGETISPDEENFLDEPFFINIGNKEGGYEFLEGPDNLGALEKGVEEVRAEVKRMLKLIKSLGDGERELSGAIKALRQGISSIGDQALTGESLDDLADFGVDVEVAVRVLVKEVGKALKGVSEQLNNITGDLRRLTDLRKAVFDVSAEDVSLGQSILIK